MPNVPDAIRLPGGAWFRLETAQIKSGSTDNIVINREFDEDFTDPHVVMLYTPNMTDLNHHHHIRFSKEEARVLCDWLEAHYLKR